MTRIKLSVPHALRKGARKNNEKAYVESGRHLLDLMAAKLGLQDFAGTDVLDIGCGTKFTQAVLSHDVPIKSYTGVDVCEEMIAWLSDAVRDSRFSYAAMNTHNEMYNPSGEPLTVDTRLPIEKESFDLICLFSVFTHLAPHDFHAMLAVLRPYIEHEGRLFFTLFINEISPNGHGLMAVLKEKLGADWQPPTAPFTDKKKGEPLVWAVYSREEVYKLMAGTGWEIEQLFDPEDDIQHHIICKPAQATRNK